MGLEFAFPPRENEHFLVIFCTWIFKINFAPSKQLFVFRRNVDETQMKHEKSSEKPIEMSMFGFFVPVRQRFVHCCHIFPYVRLCRKLAIFPWKRRENQCFLCEFASAFVIHISNLSSPVYLSAGGHGKVEKRCGEKLIEEVLYCVVWKWRFEFCG